MRRVEHGGLKALRILIGAIVIAWALLVADAARAAGGGPSLGYIDTTHHGVLSAGGGERFFALPEGDRTMLLRVSARSGSIEERRFVPGAYSIPAVALDGDAGGLSHDGSRLVLIGRPTGSTPLLLVDPSTLEVERRVDLRGSFTFDAISPDGGVAYVVEYPDPMNPGDYRLRRLTLPEGKLLPGSLLPDNDPEEAMRGMPISRATGADGRWEYTLYDGAGKEPFLHALDTVDARTLCIDLDWLSRHELYRMNLQMSADGSEVEIVDPRFGIVGRIDTETGEARQVSEPFGSAPAEEGGGGGAGGAVAFAGAALLLGGVCIPLVAWRRRGHR